MSKPGSMLYSAVQFQRLPHGKDLPLPKYETAGAAGMDLRAAVTEDTVILPGTRKAIPCGFNVAIPCGYEGQCRPRSGLACKSGITLANSPGTIDADYRGEIICFLVNHGDTLFTVKRGDRIAQMIVAPVTHANIEEVATLTETDRGAGGFGSTGV